MYNIAWDALEFKWYGIGLNGIGCYVMIWGGMRWRGMACDGMGCYVKVGDGM